MEMAISQLLEFTIAHKNYHRVDTIFVQAQVLFDSLYVLKVLPKRVHEWILIPVNDLGPFWGVAATKKFTLYNFWFQLQIHRIGIKQYGLFVFLLEW